VLDRPRSADVSCDRHIVGRVSEDHVGVLGRHEGEIRLLFQGATAHEPMGSKRPEIAAAGDGGAFWDRRQLVLFGIARLLRSKSID
jgi:hypothetical protein